MQNTKPSTFPTILKICLTNSLQITSVELGNKELFGRPKIVP